MNRQKLLYKLLVFLIASLFSIAAAHTASAQEFTALSLGDYGNVSVMEMTGDYSAYAQDGSVNSAPREAIAKEFFKTHKDEYDFLFIFSNFDYQMPEDGQAKAFHMGVKNDIQGLGFDAFDNTSFFGSSGKLQGFVDMGNLSGLVTDPLDPKFDYTLYLLTHEMMHQWGAHAKFKDQSGNNSSSLIGKDNIHWSYLFDSGGSVLYGNRWQDNGNGTFTSLAPHFQMKYFSPIDLYLMGMIDKTQVPPMLLIENSSVDPTKLPEAGVTISGTARTITIEDIIAAIGERNPDVSSSQKSFKTGFIFITQPGTFKGDEIYAIENIRSGWVTRHSVLTDGKSIVEVASTPIENIPVNPGPVIAPATPRTLPPNINDGVQWLMDNQKSDGSWADLEQTTERDTAVATLSLKNFTAAQQNYQNAIQWLGTVASGNMDFLARKTAGLIGSGRDISPLVNDVLSRQNTDGGWGSDKNYASNAADTAIALKTLATAGLCGSERYCQGNRILEVEPES